MSTLPAISYLILCWRALDSLLDELSLALKQSIASLDRTNVRVKSLLFDLRIRREAANGNADPRWFQ